MHIAGISPQESWEWTWGEGCEAVNAYMIRENDRAHKQAVALYNAAACLAHFVSGKMLSFEEAFPGFGKGKAETEEMTDEAMFAVVRALNATFGGTEVG
jgi:hypothetical protein